MTWERAWREGRTGWDAGASPPVLEELIASGTLPGGRALVPGCGAGYDVLTLASPERRVVGVDLAPTAAERFEALRRRTGVPASQARVVVADFFALEPGERFDLVWDYTFLCAIDPSARPGWAAKMKRLVAPDGQLVTLIFPAVDEPPKGRGPPHPVQPDDVRALLEADWSLAELSRVERSHPGREGMEWLARWIHA